MTELENEIALGTYLEQSQVKIMGATADIQNQGRTVVDINLVPLGEKFDNTTAALTYERFWHKKVPLNRSLFGDYAVVNAIFTSIWIFSWEWSQSKCSGHSSGQCQLCRQKPENECQNHNHHCFIFLCTLAGFSGSIFNYFEMEEE
ncbi:hypothetical protein V8G54_019546 [Vigna mungo]|uniref:Receptor-like PK ALE2 N-terminal domain-containing protein n=1 Tax=Vigna mungo TaxID=3915 RepID=A0AAQ3NAT5_VIGMU